MKWILMVKSPKQIRKCLPQLLKSVTVRPSARSFSALELPPTATTSLPANGSACSFKMTMDGPSGMWLRHGHFLFADGQGDFPLQFLRLERLGNIVGHAGIEAFLAVAG